MINSIRRSWAIASLTLVCCLQPEGGSSGPAAFGAGERAGSEGSQGYASAHKSTDDWQLKKEQNGMAAEVAAEARTPDGPAKSTLSFQCSPGKGGTSTITFIVLGAVKMNGFDFDEFEGPDAPAQRRSLVTITAHRPARNLVIRTACSGYYTVSDEGFAFEVTTMANVSGKVNQLADALIHDAGGISVRVHGLKHPQKVIEADFPTGGSAAVLGEVMRGCGRR